MGSAYSSKILLSAYACEPFKGSEASVGWEWANRLARQHEVRVLTRSNNREVIEQVLGPPRPGDKKPEFIYVDLSPRLIRWKKRGWLPVPLYYLLWQLKACKVAKGSGFEADLVHHVTFNGFRFPGAWWSVPWKVVLGPLGGASVASSHYRRCFGRRWPLEQLRTLSVRLGAVNPWTWLSFRRADVLVFVTDEMARRFGAGKKEVAVLLETAVPDAILEVPMQRDPAQRKHFVWVGMLEGWKAWELALESFASAFGGGDGGVRLKMIGVGRDGEKARARAAELGIGEQVDFLGKLPREAVWNAMREAKGLFFSSIRDTSGNVVLEAMALGCPVVCLNHQGSAVMTDDNCAVRVEPADWETTVLGFAVALRRLEEDSEGVIRMGIAGRERVRKHFTWDRKVEEMNKIYARVMRGEGSVS